MKDDYLKAKRLGERAYRRAVLTGRSPYPPALDEMLPGAAESTPQKMGLIEIPLDRIAGTKTAGRQNAFAVNFMPLLNWGSEFSAKWDALYESQLTDGIRDPILAFEYLGRFYVQEGNKRVSVSQYCGYAAILAEVSRIIPKADDTPEIRQYYEFMEFYRVCPLYGIEFTKPGSYKKLSELMGMNLEDEWPDAKVTDVRFAFSTFEKAYLARGGGKLEITAGDAFLIYAGIYGIGDLLNAPTALIEKQLGKVWNEILLADSKNPIDLVVSPEDSPKDPGILGLGTLLKKDSYTREKPLRAAFLFDRSPESSRLNYNHELGRLALDSAFSGAVDTICFSGCDNPASIRHAIDAAAADENALIFTTSELQMHETLKSAIHYPDIQFFNCSINLSQNAVQSYYARMYEAKFLMGILAAQNADNHRIGYLADYPIYGALADINAFAIGAEMIDPEVRIFLNWTAVSESNWQEEMKRQDVRVISGPDTIKPEDPSRSYGVYRTEADGSITNLAMPVIDWGKYYEQILRPVVTGSLPAKLPVRKDESVNYWWGMSSGVVDVILGKHVSYNTVKMMNFLKREILHDHLHPFDGEIHSQTGLIHSADAPSLSSKEIITMDWLNDNVIGSIPSPADMSELGREKVRISGIREEKV